MTDGPDALADVAPDSYVRLDGLPFEEGASDRHVNNNFAIARGDDASFT